MNRKRGMAAAAQREHLRDRCCERCLPMVNVPDRADVNVGLGALELLLCHLTLCLLLLSLTFASRVSRCHRPGDPSERSRPLAVAWSPQSDLNR